MANRPNQALSRLLAESGLSETQFAHAVNRVAAETGVAARYGQPSVSQWLSGTTPRAPVRPLVAEVLSRRLGRSVTPAELFPTAPSGPAPAQTPYARTVEELVDLVRSDMDPSRRGVVGAGLYSVALTIPGWRDVVGRMDAVRSGRLRRIGMADVQAVSDMTERLSELDDRFGGRYARPMSAAFISHTVAPYLRADGPEKVRKAMLSAASFLCYLTGWMAVDEGLHGLAQRYYVKGLELAGASSDHLTYCHILRGMSVQAADLGHGRVARQLADAAAEASSSVTPRMQAFFAGQQAHSYAVAGDRRQALAAIRATETLMEKAESRANVFGGYNPSTVFYHLAQVRYELGDVPGSIESLRAHFRLRVDGDSRRSSVRFRAMMAERLLEIGHLEAACESWNRCLDEYPAVHSGRADEHVRRISRILHPYRTNPLARSVLNRAREATV
ncbi:tetratricopeptide repeat protein [Streptomyces sp. RFCAC02]|uniref:tetratricopeptide repeat protein n=1 Tax=Streptomyces sp. RFCAC02 TaxID=2499143 RepID=UPI00101F97AE|nr:tetratricopeptide repeat protein [Streptomyces sp. RFCAC02]